MTALSAGLGEVVTVESARWPAPWGLCGRRVPALVSASLSATRRARQPGALRVWAGSSETGRTFGGGGGLGGELATPTASDLPSFRANSARVIKPMGEGRRLQCGFVFT